ncbi:MAG: chemotaxis protein CheW [Desulfatibacillaceae bacterium]
MSSKDKPEDATGAEVFDSDEDRVKAVLDRRARQLAKLPDEEAAQENLLNLVVFPLGRERYGIDIELVREIQPLGNRTRVPCTPDFLAGVVNIRGRIYSLMDIARFLGLPPRSDTGTPYLLLVKGHEDGPASQMELCIVADDVPEVLQLPVSEVHAGTATVSSKAQEYVRGVTNDMLTVLDMERLLASPGIVVHEEI